MAAEISRSSNAAFIRAGMQAINDGIAQAALSQAPESIEKAIQSFDSILDKQKYTETPRKTLGEQGVAVFGSVAPPVEYLAMAAANGAPAGEIISTEQLLATFRNPGFRIQMGVQSFLGSGIQEALASLRPKLGAKFVQPEILEPLNELLAAAQIKDLNASRLQPSIDAVNELYSTLKKTEAANTQLQMNMLRTIRA